MNRFKLGKNSTITANNMEIDDSVIIGDNVIINCDMRSQRYI